MPPQPLRRHHSGVAIIVVLFCVVLLAGIVLSFVSGSKSERIATAQTAAREEARALSDLAVTLVQGQIREATLSAPGTNAWASQPGAIRLWDHRGDFVRLYKLYSSAQMVTDSLEFLIPADSAADLPDDWRSRPSEFVDLNEPISVRTSSTTQRWVYPILNPDALTRVDGFESAYADIQTTSWDDRAAMPVRWLYVLRDGTIGEPAAATSANPIVGRIAFWTDDDSCKVNINTASGTTYYPAIFNPAATAPTLTTSDSFWDIPVTYFMQDRSLGYSVPAEGEYHRIPAHPASINLRAVMKDVGIRDIFRITPRYGWGGSENATIPHTASRTPLIGTGAKRERLYASVDELQFSPLVTAEGRSLNPIPAVVSGTQGQPAFTSEEMIDLWRFFLTAHSRSPDLNLFGRPRIALWPISGNTASANRTAYDRMIARCSTLGAIDDPKRKEYFFQRINPLSTTDDWTLFPRNQELFTYLQTLTDTPIPGFGGSFRAKYDANGGGVAGEWNQILTEIFDYIRCINLNEGLAGTQTGFQSYTRNLDPQGMENNANFLKNLDFAGAGFVLPISIAQFDTRGAGRAPTIGEVSLAIIHATDPSTNQPTNTLQSALFFETFSPMLGFMPWSADRFNLSASCGALLNGAQIYPGQGSPLSLFPAPGRSASPINNDALGSAIGGPDGISWLMPGRSATLFNYPFSSNRTTAIPAPLPTITLSGGTVTARLSAAGSDYQTLEAELPTATLSRPTAVSPGGSAAQQAYPDRDWAARRDDAAGYKPKSGDVIKSMVLRDGDARMIAYLSNVPKEYFIPHPDFSDPTKDFAHTLHRDGRNVILGSRRGGYVPVAYGEGSSITGHSATAPASLRPKIHPDITDLINEGWAGDWDTGIAGFPDGSYLNKSDEGCFQPRASDRVYYVYREWARSFGMYSPVHKIPSAAMFGSLPTGVKRTLNAYQKNNFGDGAPWRTLLFCPNPAAGSAHYGAQSPPDYLLLDLFNTPIVEPYAISEPFSTAGRINMNSQIVPFTGITRDTGLHAVLDSQRVTAIPDSSAPLYKENSNQSNTQRIRYAIHKDETLKQFRNRFAPNGHPENGDLFKSAAEICSLFLVPETGTSSPTLSNIATWWNNYRLTGDNLRERPYATTYPHLTTKSNVYTVHIRAQAVQKTPQTGSSEFVEGRDNILSEYRGSVTIERYIDPNDDRLKSINPDEDSLEPLYRYRIIETKPFAP